MGEGPFPDLGNTVRATGASPHRSKGQQKYRSSPVARFTKGPGPRRAPAWGLRGAAVGATPPRLSLCASHPSPPPRTASSARHENGKTRPRRIRVLHLYGPRQSYRASGKQMLALKPPTARWTVLDLLSIGFARFFVIEEDPLVAPFGPPELPPQFVCLPARAI
jgi:hypothetical protein